MANEGWKLRLIVGTINVYHPEPGWTNYHLDVSPREIWDPAIERGVQPQFVLDIADIQAVRTTFREGMFHAVRLHHVLEHLPYPAAQQALTNLGWLLAAGGILDIEVPDFLRVVRAWLDEELDDDGLNQWVYGEQLAAHDPGDSHRAAYTEPVLRRMLRLAGFDVGDRETTGLALRFVATREGRADLP